MKKDIEHQDSNLGDLSMKRLLIRALILFVFSSPVLANWEIVENKEFGNRLELHNTDPKATGIKEVIVGGNTAEIILVRKDDEETSPDARNTSHLMRKKALTNIYGTGFNPMHELTPLSFWVGEKDQEALARLCYFISSLKQIDSSLKEDILNEFIVRIKEYRKITPQFTAQDAKKYMFGQEILSFINK